MNKDNLFNIYFKSNETSISSGIPVNRKKFEEKLGEYCYTDLSTSGNYDEDYNFLKRFSIDIVGEFFIDENIEDNFTSSKIGILEGYFVPREIFDIEIKNNKSDVFWGFDAVSHLTLTFWEHMHDKLNIFKGHLFYITNFSIKDDFISKEIINDLICNFPTAMHQIYKINNIFPKCTCFYLMDVADLTDNVIQISEENHILKQNTIIDMGFKKTEITNAISPSEINIYYKIIDSYIDEYI